MIIILMGVSGSGKSAVGKLLSKKLGWDFIDGDDHHPIQNLRKMANGIPLCDEDREPWLNELNMIVHGYLDDKKSLILACSALKKKYREILGSGFRKEDVKYVFLKGNHTLILERLRSRTGHYMKPEMLQSQFDILEEPENAVVMNIDCKPDVIVNKILKRIDPSLLYL